MSASARESPCGASPRPTRYRRTAAARYAWPLRFTRPPARPPQRPTSPSRPIASATGCSSTPTARRSGVWRRRSPTCCAASASREYTPHIDTGDFVVVVNAEKIARDRQQAQGQALLPPLRLPGRPALAHVRGDAGAPARGDHQARRQGNDAPQPPRAQADHQAQDLRRARASARGAETPTSWRSRPAWQTTRHPCRSRRRGRSRDGRRRRAAGSQAPTQRAAHRATTEVAADATEEQSRRPRSDQARADRAGPGRARPGRAGCRASAGRASPRRARATSGGPRRTRRTRGQPRAPSRRYPAPTSRSTSSPRASTRWAAARSTRTPTPSRSRR